TVSTQKAAFGDVTWRFAPRWDATTGLRWFWNEQRIDAAADGVFNGGPSTVDNKHSTNRGGTPRFALNFRPKADKLCYGSIAKSYRPGGPNRFSITSPLCIPDLQRPGLTSAPAQYNSDQLWTYEIGAKATSADRAVTVEAAVFDSRWNKIQQQI